MKLTNHDRTEKKTSGSRNTFLSLIKKGFPNYYYDKKEASNYEFYNAFFPVGMLFFQDFAIFVAKKTPLHQFSYKLYNLGISYLQFYALKIHTPNFLGGKYKLIIKMYIIPL